MKAYIDCEWDSESDGGHGGTISIGIHIPGVRSVELVHAGNLSSAKSPWVRSNVTVLPPASQFADLLTPQALAEALEGVTTIVADWPEDIARLCSALVIPSSGAPAIAWPKGCAALTFVVDRRLSSAGSDVPHNALADAIAIANSAGETQ